MKLYLISAIGILSCLLLACNGRHSHSNPSGNNGDFQGIDVSHHQGVIDWEEVATNKNIKFVYIKATEGSSYTDPRYSANARGARANGIYVGSYHYLRNSSSIRRQFAHFTSTVDIASQDLVPMVDVEERVKRDSIALFCSLVREWCGKKPVIYGTNRSYNSYCAPDFNDHLLLIGRYGKRVPVIIGRGHYNIWQFSEKGHVTGIPKPVDLDRFHPDTNIEDIML